MRTQVRQAGVLASLISVSISVVVLASVRHAVPPPPPPGGAQAAPDAPQTGTGFIFGRVVDAGSPNTPISDAVVTLSGSAFGASSGMFSSGVGGPQRISTDGEGHFLFRDLAAGTYQMAASADGYANGGYGQTRPVNGPGRPFGLADGERVGDVTIRLWKQGTISGTVVDEAGEPMVEMGVRIESHGNNGGGFNTVTTDDRGMYHVTVASGDYVVGVVSTPTTVPVSTIDDYQKAVEAGPAASRAYIDERSAAGAPLAISSGIHVGALVLAASNGRGGLMASGGAADDGRLFLYSSTYYQNSRTAAAATVVSVGSGEHKSGIDLQLRPVPTYRVSGSVAGPGGPATNIGVRLIATDPGSQSSPNGGVFDSMQTVTDGTGDFTFLGVTSGQYTLRVLRTPPVQRQTTSVTVQTGNGSMGMSTITNTNVPVPQDPILWAMLPVAVGDSDLSGLAVVLRTGARVNGHLEYGGSDPPTPDKLNSLRISLQALPGSPSAVVSAPSYSHVDENGQFTTSQFAPGSYLIGAGGLAGWTMKSAMVGGKDAADVAVELGGNDLNDVVITMTNHPSKVSGTAGDAQSQPASSSTVVIFSTDHTLWPKPGSRARRVTTTSPGRDGKFALTGLPAGEYFIIAVPGTVVVDPTDAKQLASLSGQAVRISVADGGTVTQDLRVVDIK